MPTRISSPSISSCSQLGRRRAVGEHQTLVLVNPPRWNRGIGVAETHERSSLILPGHQPEDAPGAIDYGIGQRHPTPALVDAGQRNVCVVDLENRVSWYQGGGVAVRPETQMNEVEH